VRNRKIESSSDCGNSGRKKCKRGHGGAYGGVWRNLCFAGIRSQAVGFASVRLTGIWLQQSCTAHRSRVDPRKE
jgi:hypothetical protein